MNRALVCALLLALSGSACSAKTEPPATTTAWTPSMVLTTSATLRDQRDVRGLIHAHSPYSHDACDKRPRLDGGEVDPTCMRDFREGACASGHDFIFLSDHGESFNRTDFVAGLLYDASKGDVLELSLGQPVANRLACPDGGAVLVLSGTETDMMPVGLRQHIAETPRERAAVYGVVKAENIDTLRDAGAVVILQHTENWTADQLVSLPIDGFEMYNLHNNAVVNAGNFVDVLARVARGELTGLPHPDLTFALLRDVEQPKYVDTWGTVLARGVKRVTTMGTDCHRNSFPELLADGERIDSYRRMMRMFSNHLLIRGDVTRDSLWQALEARRLYGVFELLGYAQGFDFHAESGDVVSEMGDTVKVGATLVVTMPQVAQLDPGVTPPLLKARLLKAVEGGWLEVAAGRTSLRYETTSPGAYRAEIRMVPRHLAPWSGEWEAAVAMQRPWVYSNAIDVE